MEVSIKDILTSRAVWMAVLAVFTAAVGLYGWLPNEIWIPIVALLTAIFTKFTVNDLGVAIGRTIARALRGEPEE